MENNQGRISKSIMTRVDELTKIIQANHDLKNKSCHAASLIGAKWCEKCGLRFKFKSPNSEWWSLSRAC